MEIIFKDCKSPNYQALSLLVLYIWRIKQQGCAVTLTLDDGSSGASAVWKLMGAPGLFQVTTQVDQNFGGNPFKPLIALRNADDFKSAISKVEDYTKGFNVEYMQTLRYVLSELLYNTLEHGISHFFWRRKEYRTPSLIQFAWYQNRNQIHFIVADVGVGVKQHLEQAYPLFESDEEALKMAIRPNVSGTFGNAAPYSGKNNAGVGLFISSNIIRRLKADMHIVSGNGVLHVSPRDITGRTMPTFWPGTFVLVEVKLEAEAQFALHDLMQEFRETARKEIERTDSAANLGKFYFQVENIFGPYAEDKEAAIRYRDSKLIPAIYENKKIVVDFSRVESSPHSFLSALLATPIKILGMDAYKAIRILNASPEIRETIDFILDENTET